MHNEVVMVVALAAVALCLCLSLVSAPAVGLRAGSDVLPAAVRARRRMRVGYWEAVRATARSWRCHLTLEQLS